MKVLFKQTCIINDSVFKVLKKGKPVTCENVAASLIVEPYFNDLYSDELVKILDCNETEFKVIEDIDEEKLCPMLVADIQNILEYKEESEDEPDDLDEDSNEGGDDNDELSGLEKNSNDTTDDTNETVKTGIDDDEVIEEGEEQKTQTDSTPLEDEVVEEDEIVEEVKKQNKKQKSKNKKKK